MFMKYNHNYRVKFDTHASLRMSCNSFAWPLTFHHHQVKIFMCQLLWFVTKSNTKTSTVIMLNAIDSLLLTRAALSCYPWAGT